MKVNFDSGVFHFRESLQVFRSRATRFFHLTRNFSYGMGQAMNMKSPTTGDELKAWRTSRGYSRAEIGDLCGKNPRTVEYWEQAGDKPIPLYAQRLIAHLQDENRAIIDLSDKARAELEKRAVENNTTVGDELAKIINGIFGLFIIGALLAALWLLSDSPLLAAWRF